MAAPQADGSRVPVEALSASAYEDLRRCPYRFFALRQLGLKEAEEVESEVDKRDFGNWLHSVLRGFHESLHEDGEPADGRAALLDRMAAEALAALRVDEGEFLPFHAGWKGVRDAYLEWLQEHEAAGARFEAAEARREARVAGVRLHGYIDRIDRLADGMRLVIDYKTESDKKTKDRVRDATEDTQLAFYAALLGDDTLRAAYLNVSERGIVTLVRNDDVLAARELLLDGIASELSRISAGATMPALGEGVACDFCAARGLCRKDAWS